MCRYHARIEYCPLYVASHEAFMDGCVRDLAADCEAQRDVRIYTRMLAKVRARDPRMVALCLFNGEHAERREKIERAKQLLRWWRH